MTPARSSVLVAVCAALVGAGCGDDDFATPDDASASSKTCSAGGTVCQLHVTRGHPQTVGTGKGAVEISVAAAPRTGLVVRRGERREVYAPGPGSARTDGYGPYDVDVQEARSDDGRVRVRRVR